jgi:hypothetical protein
MLTYSGDYTTTITYTAITEEVVILPDGLYLGTSVENANNWGTAWSAVKLDEYRNGDKENKTGLWKQRLDALTGYFINTLDNYEMSTESTSATSAKKNNWGLLSTASHEVEYHSGSDGGMGSVDLNSIYGRRADAYARDTTQAQSGYNQLIRKSSSAAVVAYDSSAAADSGYESESAAAHTWNYHADTDSWTGINQSSNTLDDHGMGIYAFVTGITYDSASNSGNLVGWFSVLGDIEDILINGQSVLGLGDDYCRMGADVNNSQWFDSYDIELNLNKLSELDIVKQGNNNLAFIVDSYPAEILLGIEDFTGDKNDSLIAFAADIWQLY